MVRRFVVTAKYQCQNVLDAMPKVFINTHGFRLYGKYRLSG